jgi:hypothetical protein
MLYDVDTELVKMTEETRGTPRLMRQLKSEVTPFSYNEGMEMWKCGAMHWV